MQAIDFVADIILRHKELKGWKQTEQSAKYSESTLRKICNRTRVKNETLIEITLNLASAKHVAQMLKEFSEEFPEYRLTRSLLSSFSQLDNDAIPLNVNRQEVYLYTGAISTRGLSLHGG